MAKDVRCPDCKHLFSIEEQDYEHGDLLNCPSCNLELIAVKESETIKIKTAKQFFMETEADDFELSEELEDYEY